MLDDSKVSTGSSGIGARIELREEADIVVGSIEAGMVEDIEYIEGELEIKAIAQLGFFYY